MRNVKWVVAAILGTTLWMGRGQAEDAPVVPPVAAAPADEQAKKDLEERLKKEADNPTVPEGKGKGKKGAGKGNKGAAEDAGEGTSKRFGTLLATGENFDANFDGKLDDAEKAAVKTAFEKELKDDKDLSQKILLKFDEDHDLKLSDKEQAKALEEYIKAADTRASERHTQFKKLDTDSDGKLTAEEWATGHPGKKKNKAGADAADGKVKGGKRAEKLVEQAFSKFDKDGDRKLDEGEWNKAVGEALDSKSTDGATAGVDPEKKKKNKNKA